MVNKCHGKIKISSKTDKQFLTYSSICIDCMISIQPIKVIKLFHIDELVKQILKDLKRCLYVFFTIFFLEKNRYERLNVISIINHDMNQFIRFYKRL